MSSDCINTLATFSTLGFVIVLGLPAILATAWTIIRIRQPKRIAYLTDYSIRFISSFSSKNIFLTFFGFGLIFIFSGLLCLVYYFYSDWILIEVTISLQIVTMVSAFLVLLYIALKTQFASIKEIQDVIDYVDVRPIDIIKVITDQKEEDPNRDSS